MDPFKKGRVKPSHLCCVQLLFYKTVDSVCLKIFQKLDGSIMRCITSKCTSCFLLKLHLTVDLYEAFVHDNNILHYLLVFYKYLRTIFYITEQRHINTCQRMTF